MLRCRDNQLMRVSLIETDKWFQDHPSTIKARQETKFSADFQIFSYRILLQIKTKRYQDKVAELSNQLTTSLIHVLLVLKNTLKEREFQHTISKAVILYHHIMETTTLSLQVVAWMGNREAHLKTLAQTRMVVSSSRIHSRQGWRSDSHLVALA